MRESLQYVLKQTLLDNSQMSNSETSEDDDTNNSSQTMVAQATIHTSSAANRKRPATEELNDTNKRYTYNVSTSNRFTTLQNNQSTPEDTNQPTKQKIPPIFLHNAINYQEILKDLNDILKDEFTTEQRGSNTIKINTSTISDYRTLTSYYDSQNLKFHTFSSPNNNLLSVIIRNIPISLTTEEVKNELETSFEVKKVVRLLNKQKQPMPLCVIDLIKNEKNLEIFKLKHIFKAVISVEPRRKSKDIPQCTKCQRYGHTKNFCRLDPRCVKCTGMHHYSECKKGKTDNPKCVNCDGEHTANYKGCQYYKNIIEKKNFRPNSQSHLKNKNFANPPSHTQQPSTSTATQNPPKNATNTSFRTTYASIIKNKPATSNQTSTENDIPNVIQTTIQTVINLILDYIQPILQNIKLAITQVFTSVFSKP